MGQALYRRYRSKSLAEIVGQEHITQTLHTALQRNAISHAYLLTGPRGVGKTSIARILAHQINNLPYEGEKIHLDIIEIDAASNRRIDEIRDLRDKVHNAPTSAKYKVYIIDEVHMLTREAFNALLKTLEEPPAHAIFILATTDVHKLPDTIISRTQHFTFKPIAEEQAAKHLKDIADKEKINIDTEALQLIARHGGGSFRDSISLLEQAAALGDTVKLDDVRQMLGIPPDEYVKQLITSFEAGDTKSMVETLENLSVRGYQADQIASQAAQGLRRSLIDGTALDTQQAAATIKELLEVPASHDPRALLEIVLLSHIKLDTGLHSETPVPGPQTTHKQSSKTQSAQPSSLPKKHASSPKDSESKANKTKKEAPPESKDKTAISKSTHALMADRDTKASPELWQDALKELKKAHNTLYSVARMATFDYTDDTITLGFRFSFHQKQFETSKNKKLLADILQNLTGREIKVVCMVSDAEQITQTPKEPAAQDDNSPLDTISNIFGGGEMLES